MKILLTGAAGQLGQELLPLLENLGEVTCADRAFDREGTTTQVSQDLSDLNRVEVLLNRMCPDLVVNACAYTAVDAAEADSQLAFRLNGDLPGCLARWSQRNEALLFHYSTDYVFDGQAGQPYTEEDEPRPLNVYGESKLAGEWAVKSSGCRNIVLRTSWVYSDHGSNFVLSMLRLARQRPSLQIVRDQVGCPTWARNLANASAEILTQLARDKSGADRDGLYHYCDASITSWYDFALAIFSIGQSLGLLETSPETHPVDSSEYPQAAQRPARSVLNTNKIRSVFNIEPACLEDSLSQCLKELENDE